MGIDRKRWFKAISSLLPAIVATFNPFLLWSAVAGESEGRLNLQALIQSPDRKPQDSGCQGGLGGQPRLP
jgi:hypothetical protein